MTNVFAALAIEAVGGFAIAGAVTTWLRARLTRGAVPAASE